MFCSGCGHALAQGQPFCPQCGRPAGPMVPAIPGFQFELESYAGKIRILSIFWFVYGGFGLLTGVLGLTVARAFFAHHFDNWNNVPWPHGPGPDFFGPALIHIIWIAVLFRTVLAFAAGWALMERSKWGRILAIVAAIFSLIKIPFGTAIGIWTLVMLLGYRNTTLYEQL
jgi:hypothetical protein